MNVKNFIDGFEHAVGIGYIAAKSLHLSTLGLDFMGRRLGLLVVAADDQNGRACAAKASAMDLPIPLVEPVTMTT